MSAGELVSWDWPSPAGRQKCVLGVYTQSQTDFSPYCFVRVFLPNSWFILNSNAKVTLKDNLG